MRIHFPMAITQLRFQKSYKGNIRAWCDMPALDCTFDFEWQIFGDGHNLLTITNKLNGQVLICDTRSDGANLTEAEKVFFTLVLMSLDEVVNKFVEAGRLGDNAFLEISPNATLHQRWARLVPEIVAICTRQTKPQEQEKD